MPALRKSFGYTPARMFEFDRDTDLVALGPGVFRGRVSDAWNIGPVPNGGYVLSIGAAAVGRTLEKPDLLTITGHFLRPAMPGDVRIEVDVAKEGRSYATASARMLQGDSEVLRLLATFGDLGDRGAVELVKGAPPALPPRDTLERREISEPAILQRFDLRLSERSTRFMSGERSDDARVSGYVRFADDRPVDVASLPLLADAFPPPIFHVVGVGWVPTLELTVHVRARPESEWLMAEFATRFAFGGHLEEDGELWDETGTLVALSRQIARLPATTRSVR